MPQLYCGISLFALKLNKNRAKIKKDYACSAISCAQIAILATRCVTLSRSKQKNMRKSCV